VELYLGLAAKTAALLYGLSKSQACHEGNKRVALLLTVAFLHENDARLNTRRLELAEQIVAIAESDPTDHDDVIAALTTWIAARLQEDAS